MSQRAHALVDLGAIRHNVRIAGEKAPRSRIYAAVKADAYGHGAARVAPALAAAHGLAVASLEEAVALRCSGIRQPIMLLSEPLDRAGLPACAEHRLEPILFESSQLDCLARYPTSAPVTVWVKLDTGMHRLGFPATEAGALYARIAAVPHLRLAGWVTHLACADDLQDPATSAQIARFHDALEDLPGARSIANSAGICAWPASHADVVRPGIMLYGASPLRDRAAADLGLRPAMTLAAPLISRTEVPIGDAVGYGATWRADETAPLGVIAIGYGDGYPRHAPNGTPVLVNGVRVPLVGRVSMDMIVVDLRACPGAQVGDQAVLWGPGLPADEVAARAGTIAYELFCRLSSRVRFEYC